MKKEDILPVDYKALLAATSDFTDQEFGCYVRLLIKNWDANYISNDIEKLKRISDSIENNQHILSKFKPTHELGLQNPKMEQVRKIWQEEFTHKPIKKKPVKQNNKTEKQPLYFPFTSEAFLQTWSILLTQKKWANKSQEALQGSLNTLSEAACEEDAIKMIQKTINGNWQGIFELKPHEKHGAGQTNNYTTRIGNSRNNQEASRSVAQNIDNALKEIEKRNNS